MSSFKIQLLGKHGTIEDTAVVTSIDPEHAIIDYINDREGTGLDDTDLQHFVNHGNVYEFYDEQYIVTEQ